MYFSYQIVDWNFETLNVEKDGIRLGEYDVLVLHARYTNQCHYELLPSIVYDDKKDLIIVFWYKHDVQS